MTVISAGRRRSAIGRITATLLLIAAILFSAAPARADAVFVSEQPLDGWDTNGTVYATKIVGNVAYIGGDFSLVRSPVSGTQTRNNLAAINMTTGAVTSFRADTNSVVRAIDGDSNDLWIGGQFTSIGGQSRNRIAAVDTTTGAVRGDVTTSANGTVHEVLQNGNAVYIGGSFTSVDGSQRNRVARIFTSNGSLDGSWNPNANATVRGLAMPDNGSIVYVGGSFTSISGSASPYVVGLSPTTGAVVSPSWGNLNYPVLDLDVTPSGDRLMGAVAGLGNRITVWNTTTGSQSWRIIVEGDVQAVKYHSGNVYFGFHDAFQGNSNVKLLSADVYNGTLEPWQPSISAFFGVWDIDATGAGLVAGGPFTSVEGVPTRGVAIFPPLAGNDSTPPTTPENFIQTDSTATTVSLAWDPSTDDTAVTVYTISRDGLPVATTADTFFTDEDLLPGVQYSYEVTAGDAASNESLPAGPLLAMTSDAFVPAGGPWSYLDNGSNQGTGWRAQGFDASSWPVGNAELGFGDGGEATLLTPGAITYYFVKDFAVTGPLIEDATLLVKRDDGIVVYLNGVEAFRDNMPGGSIAFNTTASTTIAGTAEAVFNEATVSASLFATGTNRIAVEVHQRSVGSSDVSFDLALFAETAPDSTGPTVPGNPSATEVLDDSVTLAWEASTDDVELANYVVSRDGSPIATTTALTFTDTTVSPLTSYDYTIEAFDTSGNGSGASATVAVTTPSADTEAPTVPTGLATTGATETSIDLSWNPSTDNVGVAGYTVRRDGGIVGTATGTTFQDTGLNADTSHSYTVEAFDAVPNTSGESAPLIAATLPPDTTPPSVPTGLQVTGQTATTVDLTWNASTDDRGVGNYIVRRDGGVVGNVATPGFTDTGLVPGTGYQYTVEAEDLALNPSGETTAVPATTDDDSTPPSVPTSLQVTDTTQTTVSLSWGPSTDDVALDVYVIHRNGVPIATTTATTFIDSGLAWSTTYSYEVSARDTANNESGKAGPVDGTTDANLTNIDLIPEGDVWKYLEDGSDQGTTWQALGYNDSSWDSGPGQLGFGDGDEDTTLTRGFITYYFRNTFELTGDVQGTATLRVLRDDAVAVHINGVEVFTDNLPASYNYLTGATKTVAGPNERTFLETTVPASVFVAGTNIVAVEIHQRSLSSSDISFDLSLNADVAVAAPDSTPPSVPTGLAVGNETLSALTLSWSPSTDNVGVSLYVVRRDGGIVGSTASTSFDDSGLASATTYSYTVEAQDAAGNPSGQSSPINGTTLTPDGIPPTNPSGLTIDDTTQTTIDISWTASTDNDAVAGYTIRVDGSVDGTTTGTSYSITGLDPDTEYAITVQAFDPTGNTSDEVATTASTAAPDTINPTDPTELTTDDTTRTTIDISWTASTDNVAVTGYTIRVNGVIDGTTTSTSYQITGLAAGVTYTVSVQAFDGAGNTSNETSDNIATDPPDTTPPSDPSNLSVDSTTETTIDLSWTASSDDEALAGYVVRRGGVIQSNPTTPTFSDSGLTPDTLYNYTVQAIDVAGNASSEVPIQASTAADTTSPTVPTGLTVTNEQVDSISLDWNPSTDNIGVDEYIIYRDLAEIDRTTQTDYTDTNLATNTTFSYTVEAVDAAGNGSGQTAPVEGTTTVVVSTQTLVAEGATWKYLDDGSDQGTAWRGVGFNDTSWDSGPAQLGFGDGDEATVLQSGFITYYFRKSIDIDGTVVSDVELRFKRDDAIAVYVNGALVESNNLPNNYNYLSGATTTVPNNLENAWVTRTISASFFNPGGNVIAVEIHNRSTSSSDITFDLTLTADVQGGAAAPDVPAAPDAAALVEPAAIEEAARRRKRR